MIETVRMKQRRSFRIAFVFQYIVSENRFKKDIRPAQTLSPQPLPLFTGAMRHGTNAKGWTGHVRGLFSVKKPPVSSIQAAFGYIPQPPQPPPPQGPPPRKGLGGIGRTGPTLKGFAPCFRFAAESSRSVSALPQLGQGGQASSGPTMSSNSQEQEEQ